MINKKLFAPLLVLASLALAGCSTTSGSGGGIVQVGAPGMNAYVTNSIQSGRLTAESACVQPVPNSRNCVGGVVLSRPGVFRPSVVAVIPVDCQIDPDCTVGQAVGGVGEPTGNVVVGALGNIFGGAFANTGDTNVTAYGGSAAAIAAANATSYGSVVNNTNNNHNNNGQQQGNSHCGKPGKPPCGGGWGH